VEVSQSPLFRRRFASVYDALDNGKIDPALLRQALVAAEPGEALTVAGFAVYAPDTTISIYSFFWTGGHDLKGDSGAYVFGSGTNCEDRLGPLIALNAWEPVARQIPNKIRMLSPPKSLGLALGSLRILYDNLR